MFSASKWRLQQLPYPVQVMVKFEYLPLPKPTAIHWCSQLGWDYDSRCCECGIFNTCRNCGETRDQHTKYKVYCKGTKRVYVEWEPDNFAEFRDIKEKPPDAT